MEDILCMTLKPSPCREYVRLRSFGADKKIPKLIVYTLDYQVTCELGVDKLIGRVVVLGDGGFKETVAEEHLLYSEMGLTFEEF
jgi:hypothetical protein